MCQGADSGSAGPQGKASFQAFILGLIDISVAFSGIGA
jgi:hypothetical protein